MELPDSTVTARSSVELTVCAACGVPAPLVQGLSDGTAMRESWRRMLHGTIAPVMALVAQEVRLKLGDFSATFEGLAAADVSAKSRALGVLVKSGISLAEARGIAGL